MRNLAFALSFAFPLFWGYTFFHHNTDHCQDWAKQTLAGEDDYGMHLRGCDDVSGTYRRVGTRCMDRAYDAVLKGFTGEKFYVSVGRDWCVLNEDGTWEEE